MTSKVKKVMDDLGFSPLEQTQVVMAICGLYAQETYPMIWEQITSSEGLHIKLTAEDIARIYQPFFTRENGQVVPKFDLMDDSEELEELPILPPTFYKALSDEGVTTNGYVNNHLEYNIRSSQDKESLSRFTMSQLTELVKQVVEYYKETKYASKLHKVLDTICL